MAFVLLRIFACASFFHSVYSQDGPTIECGVAPKRSVEAKRIVGGSIVAEGSWPWMVALLDEGEQFCGGTLMSNQLVLTAAHCFADRTEKGITALLGQTNLRTKRPESVELAIDRVFRHPQYNNVNLQHDVAVLRLKGTVTFSDYIRPICLPTATLTLRDQVVHVAGWGNKNFGGNGTNELREVVISLFDFATCRARLDKRIPLLDQQQVCAGYERGGKDACQGDSGGPLAIESPEGKWTLVGIVSFGIGCARPNVPGVYTRVSHYLSWIARQGVPHRCGTSGRSPVGFRRKRVIGGKVAGEGQWPWIASLLKDGKHSCGGTLITDQHVLTAASCIISTKGEKSKPSDIVVRFGELDTRQRDGAEMDFNVSSIVTHELFARKPIPVNNIAIIKLRNKVAFSAEVRNICLTPTGQTIEGTNAQLAGFGVTVYNGADQGRLRHVALPVWKSVECVKAYEEVPIDDRMICAGSQAGGNGHCQGDIGGPLMKEFRKDRWTLVGIASFSRQCGLPNSPSVFTRVDSYWDWIESNAV